MNFSGKGNLEVNRKLKKNLSRWTVTLVNQKWFFFFFFSFFLQKKKALDGGCQIEIGILKMINLFASVWVCQLRDIKYFFLLFLELNI